MRYTPTRVGTISVVAWQYSYKAVHPHTRGDNCNGISGDSGITGTPPHAWGQYIIDTSVKVPSRYTPTRVGTIR